MVNLDSKSQSLEAKYQWRRFFAVLAVALVALTVACVAWWASLGGEESSDSTAASPYTSSEEGYLADVAPLGAFSANSAALGLGYAVCVFVGDGGTWNAAELIVHQEAVEANPYVDRSVAEEIVEAVQNNNLCGF